MKNINSNVFEFKEPSDVVLKSKGFIELSIIRVKGTDPSMVQYRSAEISALKGLDYDGNFL